LEVNFDCNVTKNFTYIIKDKQGKNETAVKEMKWPEAKISRIEPDGLLHIKFLQRMKIPEYPFLLKSETIILNGTKYPMLAFEIIPGQLTDPQMTKFNWTFVNYTSEELLIQLNFEHINYISS
jgi:hypothetical protein